MQFLRLHWKTALAGVLFSASSLSAQQVATALPAVPIHLAVEEDTPLRLYLTKRVTYRKGDPAVARFAEPVWAFDRIVIPAGTIARGQVTNLQMVPAMVRAMAIVRGDFTPLKRAQLSFNKLILPNGRELEIETRPADGLASIYVPPRPPKPEKKRKSTKKQNAKVTQVRSLARQQAEAQLNARTRGLLAFVRTPNKREWMEDFLWSKLPYHPQWYRSGTRFDVVPQRPLDFGTVELPQTQLQQFGTQPGADTPASIRLVTAVSSSDANVGDPIAGVLSQPLFSPEHRLVLPEGTRLTGHVTLTRRARLFHRGGQLRFAFDDIQPPTFPDIPAPQRAHTQAQLTAAEQGSGSLKVDEEGTAKATESKTRFLRPAIAGLIAAKSMDNDEGRQTASGGASANYSGRALGGFSGFGLLGTLVTRAPHPVGAALGFYGLAWSVYTNLISRGREVEFQKNTAMAIRFGRPEKSR
jgi:hypothetical protein